MSKNLIKDPTVTVDFLDLYFSVLGEVKEPGRGNTLAVAPTTHGFSPPSQ